MIRAIRNLFGVTASPQVPFESPQSEKDIRFVACALLLEIAHADSDFTDDEKQYLESAVRRLFDLNKEEAGRLLDLAEAERSKAVDLWQFTSLIAEEYSVGQKLILAEMMWGVVYSDGNIAGEEAYLMRKIWNLLRLEPGYLAEARKRVEDKGLTLPPNLD